MPEASCVKTATALRAERTAMTSQSRRCFCWSKVRDLSISTLVFLICLVIMDILLPAIVPVEKATLERDSLLGLRGRPGVRTMWTHEVDRPLEVQLNQSGFHDVERSVQKAPGTYRLISLGDSFVEAYQVPIKANFSALLESELNQDLPDWRARGKAPTHIEVLNQGIHGYGLGSYYLYVEHRLDGWEADGVLLCIFLGNDFQDNFHGLAGPIVPRFRLIDGHLDFIPPKFNANTWIRGILAHSNIAALLRETAIMKDRAVLQLARREGLIAWWPRRPLSEKERYEMLSIARMQLHAIKEHLAARHVPLFVLMIPDPFRVQHLAFPDKPEDQDFETAPQDRLYFERGLLDILRSDNLAYVYPIDLFVKEVRQDHMIYLRNTGHLSAEGHRRVAEVLNKPIWEIVEKSRPEPLSDYTTF